MKQCLVEFGNGAPPVIREKCNYCILRFSISAALAKNYIVLFAQPEVE